MNKNVADQKKVREIQQELIESVISGGIMGGYLEEGFPFYYINEKMLVYLGYESQEEFVDDIDGMVSNCMHPKDRDRVDRECEVQLAAKGSYELQYRMKKKDGSYIWVHDTGKKFSTEDGREAIISICYDITREKELFELQQDVLRNIPGGICLYKWDGTRLEAQIISEQFVKLHGGEESEHSVRISAIDFEYVYPEDLAGYQSFIQEILDEPGQERFHTFRFWNQKKKRYVWMSVNTTDYVQADGSRLIYASYSNVDEMKEAEKLLEARIQMEQERLLGGDGNLLAYVVSNINQGSIVEHKTFAGEIPLANCGESLEEGALGSVSTIIDPEKQQEFLKYHDCETLAQMYSKGITSISLEYRRRRANAWVGWERNVLNVLREPESGDLFLYEYCYDIDKEKLLEETMIAAVNYSYERVGSINIPANQISMLLPDPKSDDYHLEVRNYGELCREYAKKHVVLEDQEAFLQNVLPENLEKKLEETGAFEFSHRERAADGTVRYKQNRHAYYDRKKKIVLITRSDVTQMVMEEEEKQHKLQLALQKEKEAARIKSDFLSRMSHELRTPLNVIAGYTTLLEQNIRSEEAKKEENLEHLDSVQNATRYLLTIIGDILDYQKILSGKIELVKEKVDAKAYMKNIVRMIQPEADRKQIDFSYERLTTQSECYEIDGIRLEQILLNILHNAVKFTPAGGKVRMTAQATEVQGNLASLCFKISDTGIGMSPEFVEKGLFHAFSQENHGITSPYEGTGIGLTISRDLARLMRGDITCTSRKGQGTTFVVTITADISREPVARTRRKRTQVSYDLGGVRILLCEDNPSNQDMTRRLLERMNCVVEVADDGAIGLAKFQNSESGYYDLVLMDLRMPVMDGFQCARAIRAQQRADAAKLPILALSANTFEEDIRMALEAGMNEHLAKPVDARILYEKIKMYCS